MLIKKRSILNILIILMTAWLVTACGEFSSFVPKGDTGGTGDGGDTGGDGGDTGGGGGDTGGGDGGDGGDTGGGGDGGDNWTIFKPFNNDLYFGRSKLNVDEQKAYDLALKSTIDNYSELLSIYIDEFGYEFEGRVKIDLSKHKIKNIKTKEQLYKIVGFLVSDEPRLFHIRSVPVSTALEDATKPYIKDNNGNIKEFFISISMRYDKYSTYKNEMNTIEVRVKKVLDAVGDTSKMSKAQIVRKLHEEYLATVSFGQKGSSSDIRGSFLKPADTHYNYYKVVCEGYARSMLYLLQRLGIKSIYIVGTGFTDKKIMHAWNKVQINDNWYNLDATWDDDMTASSPNSFKDEFLKSDADFQANHPDPQKDQYGKAIGYLAHGVTLPASANKSLTPAEYQ